MEPVSSRDANDESFNTDESEPCDFPTRIVDLIFTPTNPFILVSVPAVSLMICQSAWIGGTYSPLPSPGWSLRPVSREMLRLRFLSVQDQEL